VDNVGYLKVSATDIEVQQLPDHNLFIFLQDHCPKIGEIIKRVCKTSEKYREC